MKDEEIRQVLLPELSREYQSDPETAIIEELGLCQGEARIDIAVVNGSIHGFEIKSDQDTLKRLEGQIAVYNRVLDHATLVVSSEHLKKALRIVPEWWGVVEVKKGANGIALSAKRMNKKNCNQEAEAIVQLLWKSETIDILKNFGVSKGYSNKTKWALWEQLIERLSLDELKKEVRSAIKLRGNWRSVAQPTLCDD